jgi:hypothetical protein
LLPFLNEQSSRASHITMKKARLLICIGFCVLGCRRVDHDATAVGFELHSIAIAVDMYCEDQRRLPFSGDTNMNAAAELYRTLLSNNGDKYLYVPSSTLRRYASNRCLVDLWGNPYRVVVASNETRHLTMQATTNSYIWIWSIGRNGINERRLGDDISAPPIKCPAEY